MRQAGFLDSDERRRRVSDLGDALSKLETGGGKSGIAIPIGEDETAEEAWEATFGADVSRPMDPRFLLVLLRGFCPASEISPEERLTAGSAWGPLGAHFDRVRRERAAQIGIVAEPVAPGGWRAAAV